MKLRLGQSVLALYSEAPSEAPGCWVDARQVFFDHGTLSANTLTGTHPRRDHIGGYDTAFRPPARPVGAAHGGGRTSKT